MKIAFLSYYSGSVNRGVETFVHELANNLVNLGHDVTVYQGGNKIKNSNYKVQTISLHKFNQQVLKILDTDTEIVFPTNGRWQTLLCRIWTIKYHSHLLISGQSGPGIDDRFNLFMFPDAFVGLTRYQSKWAQRVNPFVKIYTIGNGVDEKKFRPIGPKIKFDLPGSVILAVAALVPEKRLDLGIQAVSLLKNASLVIVGKGEKQKELQEMGDKLLPGRFRIMSFDHQDMPNVFRSADLFTFPSVPWESFGIVLLEAMASGLPVVANADSIRREIVGEAGLFVDPNKLPSYAEALEDALKIKWDDKPRLQAHKYTWEKIAQKYAKLCQEII